MQPTGNEIIIAQTKEWLEKAVIGLNLCPFAKAVHVKKQIRYVVSSAHSEQALVLDLMEELQRLERTDAAEIDTTLLIHPEVLNDFSAYNDFLETVDRALEELDLDGTIQVASFHPRYQFAGTKPEDITNYTNRSPYPMLHLLREESVAKAVDAFPDVEDIPEKNMQTLEELGHEGWRKLGIPRAP
ncbi:MAG: DUF1415 domain-containing protein [Bdellovibrionales bacterium]|nr:DUF1415 domain-containing protein [Bdellovibrionales bacterium]